MPKDCDAQSGESSYTDLECCLCIPTTTTTTRTPSTSPRLFDHPPRSTPVTVTIQHDRVDDIGIAAADSEKASASGGVATGSAVDGSSLELDKISTWRVLPARIAISLRLERLSPSPPPYPSCVPSIGPVDSVCRLRLRILGAEASVRTLHPESLLPRHCSQREASTVVVGWNGNDETELGQPPEWRVGVPPGRGNALCPPPGLGNDTLMDIPKDGRDRLLLTLGVATSPFRTPLLSKKGKNERLSAIEGVPMSKTSEDALLNKSEDVSLNKTSDDSALSIGDNAPLSKTSPNAPLSTSQFAQSRTSQNAPMSTSEDVGQESTVVWGSASIDWNGLSRLPVYSTDYFVETHSSPTSQRVVQPVLVDLELVAQSSNILQRNGRPRLAEQKAVSSDVLNADSLDFFGVDNLDAAAAQKAALNRNKQNVMSKNQEKGEEQDQEQEQKQEKGEEQEQEQERKQEKERRQEQEQEQVQDQSNQDQSRHQHQHQRHLLATSSCRTVGYTIRVALHLETSPISVPYELSLSPAAARGATATAQTRKKKAKIPASDLSMGDFRNPCRRQRVPYLRFVWPWDDYWLALTERRASLVPDQPWRLGSRHSVTWPDKPPKATRIERGGVAKSANVMAGEVSVRLPITLSGFDGSIGWYGDQELRKEADGGGDSWTESVSAIEPVQDLGESAPSVNGHPVMFVEAYDMGPYSRLEHGTAMKIQRVWRRGLEAMKNAREWWEYDAEMRRYNAAITVQAHYRGWRERLVFQVVKREGEGKGVAASVIQRRWR